MLRFDGIYQSKLEDYSSYIRFYEDGTVITAYSKTAPQYMKKWFFKDTIKSGIGKGNFILTNNRIRFTATSFSGIVEYEGRIYGNTIIIEAYSHITQRKFIREYEFIKLDLT